MKKFKKVITSFLLMFMMVGVFTPDVAFASNNKPSGANKYNDVPEISMDGGKLNLDTIKVDEGEKGKVFNKILTEYRGVVTFISGIGLVSMIMFFIFNLISLGNSKGNPQERQKAITGLIVSGIATAGLGSVTLITTLFYNMMSDEQ